MARKLLLLTTPDGRKFALRADAIESVFTGKTELSITNGNYGKRFTQINMKSGDKGVCIESFEAVSSMLAMALEESQNEEDKEQ